MAAAAAPSGTSCTLLLHEAARRGDVAAVNCLLAQKADTKQKEPNTGNTPLHVAALAGQVQCIEALLPHSCANMVNRQKLTALCVAAASGNLAAVKVFFKGKAKPKSNKYLARVRRAMRVATTSEVIVFLSTYVPNIAEMRRGGQMALIAAAEGGRADALRALLHLGVDPNKARRDGKSAAMHAAGNGKHECLSLLLDYGVNIVEVDWHGQTALHKACVKGSEECVEMLLTRGANVNARDRVGMTALHKAARNGNAKCVELLLDRGAVSTQVDKMNQTPLDIAKRQNFKEIIDLLST